MKFTIVRALLILLGAGVVAAIGGALVVYYGIYNVSATEQHTAPVYWVLNVAMRRSVAKRAEEIPVPPLTDRALIDRGLRLFRGNCVQCHGAPGISPEPFAMGMMPAPANLPLTAREWPPAQLYWVIRYGIKTSGMPAWEFRLADADLWAVVAFLHILPTLSPIDYAKMTANVNPLAAAQADLPQEKTPPKGDAGRGKIALQQYACVTCHQIPDVVGAIAPVGPPLDHIANRRFLAGILSNTPDNMVRWLRAPQAIAPGSAMPDLNVTQPDAEDISAYLYTLK